MSLILKLAEIIFIISTIYYGIKFLRLKGRRRTGIKRKFLISLFVFLSIGILGLGSQTNDVKSSSTDNVKVVKKYIGKDKYKLAKKEHVALLVKKNKLLKQSNQVQGKKDEIIEQKNREEEAAKQEQARQKEEQEQAQRQAQEDAKNQAKEQEQAQSKTKGDMNTSDTGQIVGNKNSHIYHVPGQRGYNMNSSNAVYFQSEQEAIAAGYRKAKV